MLDTERDPVAQGSAGALAEALVAWVVAVRLGELPRGPVASRLDGARLEALVLSLVDPDAREAEALRALLDPPIPARGPELFNATLRRAIRESGLSLLFVTTHEQESGWSARPAVDRDRAGARDAERMARWRSDFRALPPERQMMAATIVWLHRGARDSIWMRRVPCTWTASEALHDMREAGCLVPWLRLVASHPGHTCRVDA